MKQTKIDWCDCTLNPVVGCQRGCEYCYARKLNNRFKWIEDWSKPQFFPERLKALESKTPKSVFINSMSDIGFWKEEWRKEVFSAIRENPQHSYIALTKCKEVYIPYWLRQGEVQGRFFLGQTAAISCSFGSTGKSSPFSFL